MKHVLAILLCVICAAPAPGAKKPVKKVPPDLATPVMTDDAPAAGKRVRQQNKTYQGTGVYHVLYLPTDWQAGKKYPVIVEYAGNQYKQGPGTPESSNLGYGISAGRGVIWVCMPYVNSEKKINQTKWWGDVHATLDYCKHTVRRICNEYGGDPERVFIAGFSRGAIACNFLGLHDDEIASLWRGFICHSHYDGVRRWGYPGSDRKSAAKRIQRLGRRPQFISQERSVDQTKKYLDEVYPKGNFTFVPLPGIEHTDTWVLYDSPERKKLRDWFERVLKDDTCE